MGQILIVFRRSSYETLNPVVMEQASMSTTSTESPGSVVSSSSSNAIQYFLPGMGREILLAYQQAHRVSKTSQDSIKRIQATQTTLEEESFKNILPKPHRGQKLLQTEELITIGNIKI